MNKEIVDALKAGAMDALRLYAALFLAPFAVAKAFATWPPDEPFQWRWNDRGKSSKPDESRRE